MFPTPNWTRTWSPSPPGAALAETIRPLDQMALEAWAQDSVAQGVPYAAVVTACERIKDSGSYLDLAGLDLLNLPDVALPAVVSMVDLSMNPRLGAIPLRFLSPMQTGLVNLAGTSVLPERGLEQALPALCFLWPDVPAGGDSTSDQGACLPSCSWAQQEFSNQPGALANPSGGEFSLDEVLEYVAEQRLQELPDFPRPASLPVPDLLDVERYLAEQMGSPPLTYPERLPDLGHFEWQEVNAPTFDEEPELSVQPVSLSGRIAAGAMASSEDDVTLSELQRWLVPRLDTLRKGGVVAVKFLMEELLKHPLPGHLRGARLAAALECYQLPVGVWRTGEIAGLCNAKVSDALHGWVDERRERLKARELLSDMLMSEMSWPLLAELTLDGCSKALHRAGIPCTRYSLGVVLSEAIPYEPTRRWLDAKEAVLMHLPRAEVIKRLEAELLADGPELLSAYWLQKMIRESVGVKLSANVVVDMVSLGRQAHRHRDRPTTSLPGTF